MPMGSSDGASCPPTASTLERTAFSLLSNNSTSLRLELELSRHGNHHSNNQAQASDQDSPRANQQRDPNLRPSQASCSCRSEPRPLSGTCQSTSHACRVWLLPVPVLRRSLSRSEASPESAGT